jgi:endonuclease III
MFDIGETDERITEVRRKFDELRRLPGAGHKTVFAEAANVS